MEHESESLFYRSLIKNDNQMLMRLSPQSIPSTCSLLHYYTVLSCPPLSYTTHRVPLLLLSLIEDEYKYCCSSSDENITTLEDWIRGGYICMIYRSNRPKGFNSPEDFHGPFTVLLRSILILSMPAQHAQDLIQLAVLTNEL